MYEFPTNDRKLEAIKLENKGADGGVTLVARFDGKEQRIACGRGTWEKGRVAWSTLPEQPAAASGAWTANNTFTARICFYETPFIITVHITYVDGELRFQGESNVGFGPTKQAPLVGKPSAKQGGPEPSERPEAVLKGFARWEADIATFEAADRANPPPKGGILFIGSSTIRRWKSLSQDFPDHTVINRGFGGSLIADSTHFADRIVFPYEPSRIYLRAGGNDIHAGQSPAEVAAEFAKFVRKVHGRLPNTEIAYIAVNAAPSRWDEREADRELNERIREMTEHVPNVSYVDTYDITLRPDGKARDELFIEDKLHFNAEGYKLLASRVREHLSSVKTSTPSRGRTQPR